MDQLHWRFSGIKYSPITQIFYTFVGDQLYKFPVHSHAPTKKDWVFSNYRGYEGNHRKWVDITEEQEKTYGFKKSLRKLKAKKIVQFQ